MGREHPGADTPLRWTKMRTACQTSAPENDRSAFEAYPGSGFFHAETRADGAGRDVIAAVCSVTKSVGELRRRVGAADSGEFTLINPPPSRALSDADSKRIEKAGSPCLPSAAVHMDAAGGAAAPSGAEARSPRGAGRERPPGNNSGEGGLASDENSAPVFDAALLRFQADHFFHGAADAQPPLNAHAAFVAGLVAAGSPPRDDNNYYWPWAAEVARDGSQGVPHYGALDRGDSAPHGAGVEQQSHAVSDAEPGDNEQGLAMELTDEVIAIFRHTEAWKKERELILKRERQLEQAEAAIAAALAQRAESAAMAGRKLPKSPKEIEFYRRMYGNEHWEGIASKECLLNAKYEAACAEAAAARKGSKPGKGKIVVWPLESLGSLSIKGHPQEKIQGVSDQLASELGLDEVLVREPSLPVDRPGQQRKKNFEEESKGLQCRRGLAGVSGHAWPFPTRGAKVDKKSTLRRRGYSPIVVCSSIKELSKWRAGRMPLLCRGAPRRQGAWYGFSPVKRQAELPHKSFEPATLSSTDGEFLLPCFPPFFPPKQAAAAFASARKSATRLAYSDVAWEEPVS
ncbi:MAG: hypothetical protein BJ554DRAFT_6579 [Olpidium bornovanus]|uniref:Uncharacterized protein n=1 Tax=Olpidium bornovanus TaxID=278681 RepID=A0A8H7ZXV1_9FUNG|nr:MAG: hypothetical protein BJ554DRAFT_6579 [Olpidium bornovanus]